MTEPEAELVRIDATGESHPVGRIASQRMRERQGYFRLMPGPPHVIFMRYTGRDGRRDAEDGAVVRLAGEITEPGALCDVLATLGQTGWRGQLLVFSRESQRALSFDQGNVLSVSTSVSTEHLGAIMLRFGLIEESAHQQVLERKAPSQRYGDCAVELGLVAREKVFEAMRRQIEEVTVGALLVGDGTFFFLDGLDESRLNFTRAVSASALLMDAVTRMDEMRYFRVKIPSGEHVPMLSGQKATSPRESEAILCWVDGRRSITEIARCAGMGEFEATKQVYGLVQAKLLVIHPPRAHGGPGALVELANRALRRLAEAAEAVQQKHVLFSTLADFSRSGGLFEHVFAEAGPGADGQFSVERVTRNVEVLARGVDPHELLAEVLSEYLTFALYTTGGLVGSEREDALKHELLPHLAQLRPSGQSVDGVH